MFFRQAIGIWNYYGGSVTTANILSHATMAEDIIAYYSLNVDGSVPDRTNRFDATNSGANYSTSGPISGAYDFNGTSDYIDTVEDFTDAFDDLHSISFWVNNDGTGSSNERVFHNYNGGTGEIFFQYVASTNAIRIQYWNGTTSYTKDITKNLNSKWTHVVLVRTTTTNLDIYFDGSKNSSLTIGTGTYSDASVYIGRRRDTSSYHWNGRISEFGVWKRALTATEISDLYNSGNGLPWQPLPFSEDTDLWKNLVAYYNAEGQSFVDYWGTNNGIVNGATLTSSGKIDNAFDFDGSNDYVNVGDVDLTGSTMSISLWFKTSSTVTPKQILDKMAGGSSAGYGIGYVSSKPVFQIVTTTSSKQTTTTNTYSDGNWHHLVCTYDGSNMKIYIDGSIDSGATTIHTGTLVTNSQNLEIGRHNTAGRYFDGNLDEISLYNKTLSSTEVTELYNSTSGLKFRSVFQGHETLFTDLVECFTFRNDAKSDVSGTDGTVNGAIHTTEGIMGMAYDFDGTNDYLNLGNASSTNQSISLWFKEDVDTSTTRHLLSFYNDSNNRIEIAMQSSPNMIYVKTDVSGTWDSNIVTTTTFSKDTWYHLVIAHNSGTTKIYINGVLDSTHTGKHWVSDIATATTYIGTKDNATGEYWDGTIAEFTMWDKELSSDEVSDLYNSGIGLRFY